MADDEEELEEDDPDYIAKNPPEKVLDPKTYFQSGKHEGQWFEYDPRGVPIKNMKKRKPAKKEIQALEAEFVEQQKKHAQYMLDVEAWEQSKLDAEKALEEKDNLRWAFRQLGEDKQEPIEVEQLGELFELMNWTLVKAELSAVKKEVAKVAVDQYVDLASLRNYVQEEMSLCLLEVRTDTKKLDKVDVDAVYSPRSWRLKLGKEEGTSPRSKEKKKKKKDGGDDSPRSPRKSKKESPRDGGASPRGSKKDDGGASPRSSKKEKKEKGSPRADSPRSSPKEKKSKDDKEKKEKKEKKAK